jgi:glycyl-tRNA synthetase beta subunit
VHIAQLIKGEEKALHSAITQAVGQARRAVEQEDFEGAKAAIAKLRVPVDAFFEHVTVNDKDATFRENRLRLLNRIRAATAEPNRPNVVPTRSSRRRRVAISPSWRGP